MILGTSDIVLIYLITFVAFLIYKLVSVLFLRCGKDDTRVKKRLTNFKYKNYLELLDASYLVLLMATALNLPLMNMDTNEEIVQSVLTVLISGFLFAYPYIVYRFINNNLEKIRNEEKYPEFHQKWGVLWEDLKTDSKVSL